MTPGPASWLPPQGLLTEQTKGPSPVPGPEADEGARTSHAAWQVSAGPVPENLAVTSESASNRLSDPT